MIKLKKAIQLALLAVGLSITAPQAKAQVISSHFFGENAWMPDTIGNAQACQEPPCIFNGKLHHQWGNIRNSGAMMIRFGGIAVDNNMPTNYQYIKMIDSVRANGMEPILQVPFKNYRYNAQQAADIVKFVNVTSGKHVKYWVIGNEPDLGYSYTTSSQVAAYMKSFASAMKNEDPTILIIGPECAWFNQNIINGLTTPGGPDDITGKDVNGRYYLDVISFHTYPFNGTQTRADVISKLTASGSFQDNLAYLNQRVTACNAAHGRIGNNALKTAVTEANVDYQNDANDNLYGVGANSFIGGQFWAEMMGIAMKNGVDFINFWSVVEGSGTAGNIGYIDPSSGAKKSTYYHYKLMADNFRGNFVSGTANKANIKIFGSQNSQQTVVMILNQDQAAAYNYTVKLNTTTVSGTSPLKINVNAGMANEFSDALAAQSTVLLIFSSSGVLMKKYEYSLNGNGANNQAPTLTQYNGTTAVEPTTITEEPVNFEIAKLYPNPTNAKFTIQLNKLNIAGRKYYVEVFNIEGQLVLTKTDAEFAKGKEEIDLTHTALASGLYVVRLKQGDSDELRTAKVVLAK